MHPYRKYYSSRFKNIRKYLDRFQYTQDAEDLHQFRVEFKKLRTFYSIFRYCIPSFNASKDFKKLKKLYTASGILRDEDVIQGLFTQYKINLNEQNPEIKEEKRRKRIKKFYKKTTGHLKSLISLEKKLKENTDDIDIQCIKAYTDHKLRNILQKMAHPDTEAVLHEIRKEIKHLKYLSEFEQRCVPAKTVRQFDLIQNRIGSWHDKLVLIAYLEKHNPSNRRPINKLIEDSYRDMKAIKTRLLALTIG